MALHRSSLLYVGGVLLLLQINLMALADPEPTRDFTPPPSGQCPVGCQLPQKQVNSSFFLFKDADNAKPGEEGPGGKIIPVHVAQFPALASLGVSYTVLEISPCGVSPPHVHPRGTELQYVIEGTMLIGFIDTQLQLRLNVLKAGDVSVVPRGMVHFTQSIDEKGFKSIAAFNSEEAGTIFIHSALLTTPDGTIEAATGLDKSGIARLRKLTEFASRRPTVSEQCLKDVKAGRKFDYLKGATMIAGNVQYG
eukprot:TRINITY_DN20093_c0_g1_i1.p1 TRINITY_DN20093_c0_g1~~TRINITY_DN20093_c0_g1_i1.p1  ORF type:complete len:251 (+),score=45.56 TRINITY_DN20093_c0_g1_i1:171-923(+)